MNTLNQMFQDLTKKILNQMLMMEFLQSKLKEMKNKKIKMKKRITTEEKEYLVHSKDNLMLEILTKVKSMLNLIMVY